LDANEPRLNHMSRLDVTHAMAMIKPVSGTCNLDCDYCYYRETGSYFGPPPYKMSLDTLRDVVRSFMQLPQPHVSFSWQGGEPMMAGLDFFKRAVAYQQAYARRGQRVSNMLQSNGTLIDETWCAFLHRYGFLVGISIDGPPELHNPNRNDSYDRVIRGLRLLQQHQVEYNALTLVNPLNAPHPQRVYRHLRELGVDFMQFIPCIVTGLEHDRVSPKAVEPEAFGRFLCGVFDEWVAEGDDRPYVRLFQNLLLVAAGHPPELCIYQPRCGGCLLIEYNGDVFPCDFAVHPDWRVGNLRVSPVWRLLEHERMKDFAGLKRDLAHQCTQCEWLSVCYGACPLMRFRDGEKPVPSYTCAGLKIFLAHAMPTIRKLAERLPAGMAADRQPGPAGAR